MISSVLCKYHHKPLGQKDRTARETCIDEMEFDENGLIKPVVLTKEGVPAQRIRNSGK
jgi:hypothetical protein